jgi:nitrate reductase NapE component
MAPGGNGWKVGAVIEPGVRGVAEAPSDGVIAGRRETLPGPGLEPSLEPQARGGSVQSRRKREFAPSKVLKRVWIPLVVLVVVAAGGFTVLRLHGVFGSDKHVLYADTRIDDSKPFDTKYLVYQVFGPPGTVADISYFDANAEPQFVEKVTLPWSVQFAITQATSIGNIVAQGDSDSLGCRILVDGKVKAEKIKNETHAFTFCMLKAA